MGKWTYWQDVEEADVRNALKSRNHVGQRLFTLPSRASFIGIDFKIKTNDSHWTFSDNQKGSWWSRFEVTRFISGVRTALHPTRFAGSAEYHSIPCQIAPALLSEKLVKTSR
jgi:hypothetical protein